MQIEQKSDDCFDPFIEDITALMAMDLMYQAGRVERLIEKMADNEEIVKFVTDWND